MAISIPIVKHIPALEVKLIGMWLKYDFMNKYECQDCAFGSESLERWDVHSEGRDETVYKCPKCGGIGYKWSAGSTTISLY